MRKKKLNNNDGNKKLRLRYFFDTASKTKYKDTNEQIKNRSIISCHLETMTKVINKK